MKAVIDFVLELEKLKSVTRKVRPRALSRYENSAEHSWQIALFAFALLPYAPEPVDINRVVMMLLVHDVGEIDTGDTLAFVEGGWEQRKLDERAAVGRIFGMLPDSEASPLLALWEEFEGGTTAEAKFANAIDRAMPVLLNLENEGQSWRENGISYERVVRRVRSQIETGCPALWCYLESRLRQAAASGWFGADAT
jgi:putative hydrolase of HD superfamily